MKKINYKVPPLLASYRVWRYLLSAGLVVCFSMKAAHAEKPELEIIVVHGGYQKYSDIENNAAGRLGLTAQDTPASVSFVSKESIAIKGDFSGLSAVTRATGFSSSGSSGNGGTSTSVRGFNGHSSVVNTYDGTRLYVGAGTVTFPADTWTIERIEVLRGPGSVINGVGAIGATINYVPKKPTFQPIENEIAITAGSYNLQRYAFGSGMALGGRSAFAKWFSFHSYRSDCRGSAYKGSRGNSEIIVRY